MIIPKSVHNGHWIFPEKLGGPEYVGFVYAIFDSYLKRGYIGKKSFRGAGVSNRGQESNWRRYTSSSKILTEMFKERPMEEFEFIVLEQYRTKGTLGYAETWSLCFAEVPTSLSWYNTRIEKVSWAVKEPVTERHKSRLKQLIERVVI
jgi:hypothetical protein